MVESDNPFEEYNQLAFSMLADCVVAWSHVEQSTDTAISTLLLRSGMAGDAAEMVALNLEIREKCAIIASLAYLYRLDDKWLSDVLTSINTISNDLRNRRNRLLHDTWSIGVGGQIHRRTRGKLRVTKPQSRQFDLIIPTPEPASTDEMARFVTDCLSTVRAFNDLMKQKLEFLREGLPPESGEPPRDHRISTIGRLRRWLGK